MKSVSHSRWVRNAVLLAVTTAGNDVYAFPGASDRTVAMSTGPELTGTFNTAFGSNASGRSPARPSRSSWQAARPSWASGEPSVADQQPRMTTMSIQFRNAALLPSTDVSNGFRGKVEAFLTGVGGRQASLAATLSSVLVPDMLIVQPNKAGSTAGGLTWALADGYGGRKLTDDVVDDALMAIFGPLLNQSNVSAGLSTDNVGANDKAFGSTFPYLATPH